MDEKVNNFRKDYFSNECIDIYHFFTKEQLQVLNKLNLKIEDKKYSLYDFDVLEMEIMKYYKDREKLKEKAITDKEYEKIIEIFDKIKEEKNVEYDTELTAEDLQEVVKIYKKEYLKHAGCELGQTPSSFCIYYNYCLNIQLSY